MKVIIPLLFILAACSTAPQVLEGPGMYTDLKPGDTVQLDGLSLEYTSYEDAGTFTIFAPGQEPRTIESCKQSSKWDFTQLMNGYMLTNNPDGSPECYVQIFESVSAERGENGAAPYYDYEGFMCGDIFVGYQYDEQQMNPYTLITVDTATGMQSVTFVNAGTPIPGCPQVVVQETTDDYVVFAAAEN